LFISFLRLGVTAFGGPAMVAYIRDLSVRKNHWVSPDSFADGTALCQTIPGATAMQAAAYVGLLARCAMGALATFENDYICRVAQEIKGWMRSCGNSAEIEC
jgi:chromate transporter